MNIRLKLFLLMVLGFFLYTMVLSWQYDHKARTIMESFHNKRGVTFLIGSGNMSGITADAKSAISGKSVAQNICNPCDPHDDLGGIVQIGNGLKERPRETIFLDKKHDVLLSNANDTRGVFKACKLYHRVYVISPDVLWDIPVDCRIMIARWKIYYDKRVKVQIYGTFPVPFAIGYSPEPIWFGNAYWDDIKLGGFWQCPVGYIQELEDGSYFSPSKYGEISGGSGDYNHKPKCRTP